MEPKDKKPVNVDNARPGHAYEGVIRDIAAKGICPFCPEHLANHHKRPIEEEGAHWLVTENMYPYQPTNVHLLILHKAHVEHVTEVSPEAWAELHALVLSATKRRNLIGGAFLLRFGDTTFTGASVTHLHAHLIQSNPDDPAYRVGRTMPGLTVRVG